YNVRSTDTPPTKIYTLSLHDALPILNERRRVGLKDVLIKGDKLWNVGSPGHPKLHAFRNRRERWSGISRHDLFNELDLLKKTMGDRKSTRLNSSHVKISYAVFCLKKE